MDVLMRFDWLLFIAFGTVAVIELRRQLGLRPIAAPLPLLFANLPWLVGGLGKFLYRDRDFLGLLDLRIGAFAQILIASFVVLWASLVAWLFRGGAERIADSPAAAALLHVPQRASSIKLLFLAALTGGVMGLTMGVVMANGTPAITYRQSN